MWPKVQIYNEKTKKKYIYIFSDTQNSFSLIYPMRKKDQSLHLVQHFTFNLKKKKQ